MSQIEVKIELALTSLLLTAFLLFPLTSRADTMSSQNYTVDSGQVSTSGISSTAASQNYSVEPTSTTSQSSSSSGSSGSSSSGSSSNDTVSLNIYNVKYQAASPTEINITWKTNNSADEEVRYGTDKNLGSKKTDHTKGNNHIIHLDNLIPETKYYFRIYSHDDNGQSEHTGIYSLTLPKAGEAVVTAETPGVSTSPASGTSGQPAPSNQPQNGQSVQNQTSVKTPAQPASSGWKWWVAVVVIILLAFVAVIAWTRRRRREFELK